MDHTTDSSYMADSTRASLSMTMDYSNNTLVSNGNTTSYNGTTHYTNGTHNYSNSYANGEDEEIEEDDEEEITPAELIEKLQQVRNHLDYFPRHTQ